MDEDSAQTIPMNDCYFVSANYMLVSWILDQVDSMDDSRLLFQAMSFTIVYGFQLLSPLQVFKVVA